jgi:hypothetical protein
LLSLTNVIIKLYPFDFPSISQEFSLDQNFCQPFWCNRLWLCLRSVPNSLSLLTPPPSFPSFPSLPSFLYPVSVMPPQAPPLPPRLSSLPLGKSVGTPSSTPAPNFRLRQPSWDQWAYSSFRVSLWRLIFLLEPMPPLCLAPSLCFLLCPLLVFWV